jgi:hypothetical protein
MWTTVTGLSYFYSLWDGGGNVLEDCVSANRRDWGRKCQVERQAVSDCSEEKYEPRFIPWVMVPVCVCFVGCFVGRLFGLCGELNIFLCAVTSISTITT